MGVTRDPMDRHIADWTVTRPSFGLWQARADWLARAARDRSIQAQHPPRIRLVDLLLHLVRGAHLVHRRDRVADEAGATLGIKRVVGAKQHPVGSKKSQPALHARPRPEQRGVAIEHVEVVDRSLLEAA